MGRDAHGDRKPAVAVRFHRSDRAGDRLSTIHRDAISAWIVAGGSETQMLIIIPWQALEDEGAEYVAQLRFWNPWRMQLAGNVNSRPAP